MSLLMPIGTPIPPPPGGPGQPGGKVLDLQRFEQEQDAWCYAACARMVLHFYNDDSVRQCDIVDSVKHGGCCANETSETCDGAGVDPENITSIYANFHVQSARKPGLSLFQAIKQEINAKRPVEVCIRWDGSSGSRHVVIVYGWQEVNGQQMLWVHDPLTGGPHEGKFTPSRLQLGWGAGSCEFTWLGIKKSN